MVARDTISRQRGTDVSMMETRRRQNYKPRSLRWPFLVAQVAFLVAAMSTILFVQKSMPDSDTSAYVDGRPMAKLIRSFESPEQAELLLARRQVIGGGGFRPGG